MPDFSFLTTIRQSLNSLFNQKEKPAQPLKVNYPISPLGRKEEGEMQNRLVEQHGFISPQAATQAPAQPTAMPTATPTPMPTPTPLPDINELIKQAQYKLIVDKILGSFPQEQGYNPANVAFRESSLNPGKVGPLGERGLFQIYKPTWEGLASQFPQYTYDDMFQVDPNIEVARYLYDQRGWDPWVAARALGLTGGE